MKRRIRRAGLALALAAMACTREGRTAGQRPLPPGDAVWFSIGSAAGEPEVEEVLSRGAFAHVFVPALRLAGQGGAWRAAALPAPPRPVAAVPVVLVVEAPADLETALSSAPEPLAASLGDGLQRVLDGRAAFGRVEGVHLDLPFSAATAEAFGALAAKVRSRVPPDLFVTCSLRFAPDEKQRARLSEHLAALNGLAAFVFGEGARADAVAADAIGKPWWAGYVAGARGQWRSASGDPRGSLTEGVLRALTDDPRAPMGHDLALHEEGMSGFLFRPTGPIETPGAKFDAGDQIDFRQPVESELLYRFGSDMGGKRLVRGRLVVLDEASESERIFTLSALSDVLLGRPLLPELKVSVDRDATGVRVTAENRSSHASAVSHTANWVEIDVPSGHIADVQLGGFDRYEVFDAEGRPVTPGRATRVRLYETLLTPKEHIGGAAVLLRGGPAPGCCRYRSHVLAASGTELSGDWTAPPTPPTPTPRSKAKPKPRRR